ncbi:acyltransferase [Hoyosella rhizosphaerae]|uniref:Acyltransferase n=1 Tax=Hoyosella rhizosphaerae TaxID=1755582 RepID=A0A916UHA8_9ACTN|nr:acyltransferase [Hoyosella rhizosphaerae]
MAAQTTVSSSRVEWVDVAKGACILLVVLFHATNFMITRGYGSESWVAFNAFLEPIRMPLFFLVAGLFASKVLGTSWSNIWRRRVMLMLYLYGLWLLLRFGFFALVPGASLTGEESSPFNLLTALVVPHNGLWFVYALALYFAAAKLLADRDPRIQISVAFTVSLAAYSADFMPWTWQNMGAYFLFFLIGVNGKEILLTLARWTSIPAIALLAISYSAGFYAVNNSELGEFSLARIMLTLLGLALGVLAAARLRWGVGVRVLSTLGTVTLPVYLMHEIAMGSFAYALLSTGVLPADSVMRAAGPVVVALAGICGGLLLHKLLLSLKATWLFALPNWLLPKKAPELTKPETSTHLGDLVRTPVDAGLADSERR